MPRPLAVVSTFPPTRCGLATYSESLITALRRSDKRLQIERVAIVAPGDAAPLNAASVVMRADTPAYVAVARLLRNRRIGAIIIQHEFKIFGGRYGELLLQLLSRAHCPVVTVLHTVPCRPRGQRLDVLSQICRRSTAVVTHSLASRDLVEAWGVPCRKIFTIPHGTPHVVFHSLPSRHSRSPVFLSFGHLRRSKGYETAIAALETLHRRGLRFKYLIYGKDHPRRRSASTYRKELLCRIERAGLSSSVQLIDAYLTSRELVNAVQGCDVGLLPYTRRDQSSSGTLGFFLACGRPVISSDFRFARDLLDPRYGLMFNRDDSTHLSRAILTLAHQPELRVQMARQSYEVAKHWRWDTVAAEYLRLVSRFL